MRFGWMYAVEGVLEVQANVPEHMGVFWKVAAG